MSAPNFKKLKQSFFAEKLFHRLHAQRRAKFSAFVLLALAGFLAASCKTENAKPQIRESQREIADDLNRVVKIPETVERAVSLAPNLTETVFAVGAGDKLIGRTSFCNFPAEAQKIRAVGDTLNPNIENIIALKPQIVLVSTASQMENFARALERQNIAVFVTNPNDLDGIYKSIYRIGEIFNRGEKARETVEELRRRVAEVEAKTRDAKDTRVFVQIDKNSLYTIGKDSFITDLINRAGGVSVTENVAAAYPNISKETALALNPEAIILSDSADNDEPNEIFKNSPALKNGKVFKINADILSRPSPRVVDALEQIARSLHPEAFE